MFSSRRPTQNHTQQLMDELTESYGHLKLAAGHAADGAALRVAPSYDRARGAAVRGLSTTRDAFPPLYDQMREGAMRARKEKRLSRRRRWPMIVGLLAAGTAAGAIGAMAAQRRRAAAQWDEYEPLPSIDDLGYGGTGTAPASGKRVAAGAASVAETVADQAARIADTLHEKSGRGDSGSGGPSDNSHP